MGKNLLIIDRRQPEEAVYNGNRGSFLKGKSPEGYFLRLVLGIGLVLLTGCAFIPGLALDKTEYRPGKLLEVKVIPPKKEPTFSLSINPSSSRTNAIEITLQKETYTQKRKELIYEKEKFLIHYDYKPIRELYEIPWGAFQTLFSPIIIIVVPFSSPEGGPEDFSFIRWTGRVLLDDLFLLYPFMNSRVWSAHSSEKGPYPCPGETIKKTMNKWGTKGQALLNNCEIHFYVENLKEGKVFRADGKRKIIIDLSPWLDKIPKNKRLDYKVWTVIEGKTITQKGHYYRK